MQSLQHAPRNEQHRGLLLDDPPTTRGKLNHSLGMLFTALPSSPCQQSRQTPLHTCIFRKQQPSHEKDRPAGVSIKVGEEVCGPVGGATARGKGLPEVLDIGYGRIGALRGHICVDDIACIAASRIIMTCFVQTAGSE